MGTTWRAVTPAWVTPLEVEVDDLHWLAYGLLTETRGAWVAGVAASVAWVRGGRTGPITERDEQPVSRNLADAERWAAEAARDPASPPPLDVIYADLNVAPWPPLAIASAPGYAVGVWCALRWVLGVPGQGPPLVIPRRHCDGRVFTAREVYHVLTRGDETRYLPERRQELRHRAQATAAVYTAAAGQIDTVKRRFTS